MNIGGRGGYIEAKLQQARYDFSFIASGEDLEAIIRNGLQIEEPGQMLGKLLIR
ncbi:MAG: hypothetical protein CFH10_02281 [Alphaproteobacteria bacterium MarineAlpha4_Bin2]|nr:MAG: hypothetical protein CFH10_02281 [Alphaproteobacteria bacterium MarineAlpha4_Bin2]